MTTLSLMEATATYTCVEPGCAREAKSDRGAYCRCDFHRKRRRTAESTIQQGSQERETAHARVVRLADDIKETQDKIDQYTRLAVAAKRKLNDQLSELRTATRSLAGGGI